MKASFAAILVFAVATGAQDLINPAPKWDTTAGDPLMEGNAVTVSPDTAVVYVTRSTGVLEGLSPEDGSTLFTIDPATATGSSSGTFMCKSGISVYGGDDSGAGAYISYAVMSDEPSTFVIAVSHPDGAVLWAEELTGTTEGTPQIASDGAFVYITHNDGGVGEFTVLDNTGAEFYNFRDVNATFEFGGAGIYHNPAYGNYPGGVDLTPNVPPDTTNRNDILVWSATTNPFSNARGQLYGFQLPFDYMPGDDNSQLGVLYFAKVGWMSTSPPAFAKEGTEMYWGITRNQFRGWAQINGLNARFQNAATVETADRWGRGNPAFNDPPATPTMNSAGTQLFCGMASTFFVSLDPLATTADMPTLWQVQTTGIVSTNAVMFPVEAPIGGETAVVWAEGNPGIFHASNVADGVDVWSVPAPSGGAILSEWSISPDSSTLYYGLATGEVIAWTISDDDSTVMPTATPAPTATEVATDAPSVTPGPSLSPTVTGAPSVTPMPSVATDAPTTEEPTMGAPEPVDPTPPPTAEESDTAPPVPPSSPTPTTPPPTFMTSAASQSVPAVCSVLAAVAVALFMN